MTSFVRPFANMCLLFAMLCVSTSHLPADDLAKAEIVIGGFLKAEGGDWNPAVSPLKRPFGIDFNSWGDMYIIELEGGRVFKRHVTGELNHISGDGSKSYLGNGGPAADATYNGMHNCVVTPNGDLYIADSWNHCIRRIDAATGNVSTIAGTGKAGFGGDGGPATQAEFDFIMCITLDHAGTTIHVADLKNRRVRAVDLKTGMVETIAGNGEKGVPEDGAVATSNPLSDPRAVAGDSKGNVYILERGGHALRVVRPDGTIKTVAGTGQRGFQDGPALKAQFGSPKHICVDSSDNVYIADDQNKAIRKFDPAANVVSTVLGRGHGDSRIQLLNPHGVCWDKNVLYVVDTSHNRILKVVYREP